MALATYITKREGSARYYVRITIPRDLVADYGKAEVWRSLRTASQSEAKARAPAIIAEFQDEFIARRRGREVLEDDIGAIAWERYSKLIEKDERFRDRLIGEDDLDRLWSLIVQEFGEDDIDGWRIFERIRDEQKRYVAARARLHAALTSGDQSQVRKAVAPAVEGELAERYAKAEAGSPLHRKLSSAIARADAEFLRRAAERDTMDWGGVPTDPMLKRQDKPKHAVAGARIMDLYATFQRMTEEGKKADTRDQNGKIVQLFAEYVGETFPVSELSRKHLSGFRDQLTLFPKMARQVAEFKGLKFKEIIAKNKDIARPAIDVRTVNKYLSAVNPFLRWLSSNAHLSSPILTDDLFFEIDKNSRKYLTFDSDQLVRFFSSPLFQGCSSDKAPHEPGEVRIRDWRYWVPIMALFTGARLGEIAQLLVDDLRQIDGIWCAYISAEGDADKSVKTESSRRVVPIHSQLIALGLIEFLTIQRKAGSKRLFPEFKPNTRGQWGEPSKFLNKYMTRIGVKVPRLVVHSFRHLFTDRLRLAGYLDHEFGFVLGHGDKFAQMTGHYGSLKQGTAKRRSKLVETVKFKEIDFSALNSK